MLEIICTLAIGALLVYAFVNGGKKGGRGGSSGGSSSGGSNE